MLINGGYLEGRMEPGGFGELDIPMAKCLTWRGHEFLDKIKSDIIWN
ncbi:hypothetical protein LCGC14_2563940, partial [marine sediment metagenome]